MREPLTDAALAARLKAHFDAVARGSPAPSFDVQWSIAEARLHNARHHRSRAGAAAVAAAAILTVWVASRDPSVVPDEAVERLVLELTSSTAWGAPSDRWLEPPGLEILATPGFNDMTYSTALDRSNGGVTSW